MTYQLDYAQAPRIPVGISECLLGAEVRYNGGHKHSRLCTDTLATYFTFVSTCPEMNIGLGVPRETLRLVDMDGDTRVTESSNLSIDHTDALYQQGCDFAQHNPALAGFIVTRQSPSCGIHDVKVYHRNGHPQHKAHGMFAQGLIDTVPWLPIEDSGRLNDPLLRETFVTAVFALHDWQESVAKARKVEQKAALIKFHSRHKLLLMAHSTVCYKQLGNLIANLKAAPIDDILNEYRLAFMGAIRKPASRGTHCNALQHLQGYLKTHLDTHEKQSLSKSIHDYRNGIVPLVVPVTLLNHFSHQHFDNDAYINQQSYLNPHPEHLGLRNAI